MKSSNKVLSSVILGLVMLMAGQVSAASEGEYDAKEFAMHHVADSHEWHIVGGLTIPLPCIVIHDGLNVFLSNKMPAAHHGETTEVAENEHVTDTIVSNHADHAAVVSHDHETYNGFYYSESGRIVHEDGGFTLDLSITKNVATLLIVSLIMFLVFTSVAKAYKRREGEAPKGLQSFMEPLILFVRDEVVRPNLGKKSDKYLPYLLTVFFFIWISNMMGLIPLISNPNLSGNIAVTCALALITFLITNLHANKYYWGHIFNPPGVPGFVKVILVPIEIAGIFIKPVALMIRLFANITAGHIIIISLVGLIFVFGNAGENLGGGLGGAAVAVPFALFMSVLELLVAFLQAFIFTMLSALFISLAQEDHHHDDHAEHASAAHH